jgi:hypothetical protein
MQEKERGINKDIEIYNQKLSQLEAYYLEKGGVGSSDFVAFGDALRSIKNDIRREYLRKELEKSKDPLFRNYLDAADADRRTIDLIRVSRKEMYHNFFQKYRTALQRIGDVIRHSPYKSNDPSNYPTAWNDLENVHTNIIKSSSSAFQEAIPNQK